MSIDVMALPWKDAEAKLQALIKQNPAIRKLIDVFKLEIVDQPVLHEETPQLLSVLPDHTDTNCMEATAEIKLGSALIRISNGIDPALLAQIIRSVGGASC